MPNSDCCRNGPSSQPDTGECIAEVCKLVIDYEPANEDCGDCSFVSASGTDWKWVEKSRNVSLIELSNKEDDSGWHCIGPNCDVEATAAKFITYELVLADGDSSDCNYLKEKEEGEDMGYKYYDITNPAHNHSVPFDIDTPNVEPTQMSWSKSSQECGGFLPDLGCAGVYTEWGTIPYIGNGTFSGTVEYTMSNWGPEDIYQTTVSMSYNCNWVESAPWPGGTSKDCDDGWSTISDGRTFHATPWGTYWEGSITNTSYEFEGCTGLTDTSTNTASGLSADCGGFARNRFDESAETLVYGGSSTYGYTFEESTNHTVL